ncbi:MAG: hypothetical protein AMK72_02305 [Planctomycetes bacterium SM23_25]|nr:MAG: hypothetical protein AMK72_02305 [Planctomycetes bacterium SM23_25]
MTKAGREPTEDVKRAFRRAIEFVGLEVWKVRVIKTDEHGGRWVVGWAKPEWWKHDSPAIEIQMFVKFSGKVETVEIRCMARGDEGPPARLAAAQTRGSSHRPEACHGGLRSRSAAPAELRRSRPDRASFS